MDSRSLSFLWIILIFIHGCLGAGLDMRINLDWGYIYFNLTKGADADTFECAKDFSLLAVDQHKKGDILTAFNENKYLTVLVQDPGSEVCYSESVGVVYQPKSTNCAAEGFEIKENGKISQVIGSSANKLQWVLVKIKKNTPANQTTENNCLVYDIKTEQITSMGCSGKKIPGVACQKNPEPASDPNYTNMRQIVIIGSSIGLSSLVLQICILIGCAICWCRNRECCGGGRREARPKPSDAARCVRLQSLTSDGDSSAAYDHVHRDPLSRSLHSLNHLQHQQKLEQDGHLYNELGGGVAVDTSSPYSQPYTHFVPTQPRNPPPKGPPPVLPSGNEYAEPYPAAGRHAQEW